jgi:hypothetical protein
MQTRAFTAVPMMLWYAGASIGFLALTPLLPRPCIWVSTLMLPLPFFAGLYLSKDLLMEIISELEFYIVILLEIVVLVCALKLLQDDRCIFWWCLAPNLAIGAMVDAYPSRFRPTFAKCFFTGQTALIVLWNLALIFKWCTWKAQFYSVGHIKGSLAACCFTSSVTLLIFFLRHVFFAFVHEDRFIVIRSHVRTCHRDLSVSFVESEGAHQIHAADDRPKAVKHSNSVLRELVETDQGSVREPQPINPGLSDPTASKESVKGISGSQSSQRNTPKSTPRLSMRYGTSSDDLRRH